MISTQRRIIITHKELPKKIIQKKIQNKKKSNTKP